MLVITASDYHLSTFPGHRLDRMEYQIYRMFGSTKLNRPALHRINSELT